MPEGMRNHLIIQDSGVPCGGEPDESLVTAHSFVDALHMARLAYGIRSRQGSLAQLAE
jgi:hypothetical protein